MVADSDFVAHTARVLDRHGLSLPEYYVMSSAGYRVTLPPEQFVAHALSASEGDPRGHFSVSALAAALAHLQTRGLMLCLTETAIREDARRRATSRVPEVVTPGYHVGHVDFADPGYAVYREVVREIHGDDFVARTDAGFNLDAAAGRFDVYAVTAEDCSRQMDEIQAGRDCFTGVESTQFVSRDGPMEIKEWRPNRFFVRPAGYHGVLRYISSAAQRRVAVDGAAPQR
jgi:hypothetical protein